MENNYLTILGFIAATFTTISFVPQVIKIWKTNETSSISLEMFLLFAFGVVLWFTYGILKKDLAITVANLFTLVMSSYIIYKKINSKKV